MRETSAERCTVSDIGLEITGPDAPKLIEPLNRYLQAFSSPGGECPKCGSKLGGLLGSFTWGIVHGEGHCTGGMTGKKCGWPARAYHRPKLDDGSEIFDGPIDTVLAYHPDVVREFKQRKKTKETKE